MSVRITPSLAISVGVHLALAGAWYLVDVDPVPPVDRAPPPKVELVDPPETAVEVVMLDPAELATLAPVAKPAPAPIAKPAATTKTPVRIAASRVVERPSQPEGPNTPSPFATFRKGRDPEGLGRDAIRLTTPSLERIALGEQAPPSVIETSNANAIIEPKRRESLVTATITPGGRGTYKVDDLVFKGRIAADGSVSLNDKANVQHQFKSWQHIKQVLRTAGPFGLLKLDFDVTDALMRKHKIDPYASRKLAFLDETREARVELGRQYRAEVLARTSEIVRQNLTAAWAAVTDPEKRKQALFEMWDEVDETGEEELVAAGKAARAAVIGFLRAKLPAGSAHAFTAEDIARLNAHRRSRVPFAPYD